MKKATPIIVLFIICAIVTTALALTYQITKPIINDINIKNANIARTEVMPDGGGSFTAQEGTWQENIFDVYDADNNSGHVITSFAKGFGGNVVVMTGINNEGLITGVKVTQHSETPGLGTKAMTPEYLAQYKEQSKITRTNEEDATQIDAITGATITSNAVFEAVSEALKQFTALPTTGGAVK